MNIKKYFIIVLILIFAFIIRLNNLSTTPVALFGDETDIGYQAYSILKTGKRLFRQFFPIYFQSFLNIMPLQVYLTVPFTIFGLNEYTVRLPSLIMGILNIFCPLFIVKNLFKGENRANNYSSYIRSSFGNFSLAHSLFEIGV